MERGKVEAQLKGNTLRVYIYALKKRKVGVREVQHALHLSNPSLAQYHLNKLKEMGLIKEDKGVYEVVDEVKVTFMRDFLRVGTLMVPRFVMYAVFFTVFTIYIAMITIHMYSSVPVTLLLLVLLASASTIFWYEALEAWRSAPQP
ncbi:MAG: winged helix-turn-helix domain-containing protein [Nitrososphaeria archaeon]